MLFIVVIVTTLLFGKDFYNKQNPRLYTENIKAITYNEITLFPNNFTFALRIEDEGGVPTNDPENYFSLDCLHRSYYYNMTTQVWDFQELKLELVPCNETLAPDPKFNFNKNLSEWKCVLYPEEGLKLGGSWSGNFIHDIVFSISNCNSTECSNITDVSNYLVDNYRYISMFYAEYYFLPNDLKSPQNINYRNFYSEISTSIMKTDSIKFKSYLLFDDVGWIFQDIRTSSVIAFDRNIPSFEFIRVKNEKDAYNYYSLFITYSSDSDKTYRSYMKIQELAALVGGFMKIITFIGEMICGPYNRYLMKKSLVDEFFDNQKLIEHKISKKLKQVENRNKENEEDLHQNKEVQKNCNQVKDKIDNSGSLLKLRDNSKKLNEVNKEEPTPIQKSMIFPQRNRSHFNYKEELTFDFKIKSQNLLKASLSNKTAFKINFLQYIKNLICKSSNDVVYKFTKASELLNKKLDIATYMKISRQFELFKSLHLNYYQDYCLNFIKKPNINNQEDLEIINLLVYDSNKALVNDTDSSLNHFNEMIYYLNKKHEENNLSEMDLKIVESLVDPIKVYLATCQSNKNIK